MDKSISKAVSLNYPNINQVDRIDSVIGTKKVFKKHYFCDNFDTKLYDKLNNTFSSWRKWVWEIALGLELLIIGDFDFKKKNNFRYFSLIKFIAMSITPTNLQTKF